MYIETKMHQQCITQIKMAEDLKLSRSAFNDIINAKSNPTFSRVMMIFRYLKIDINDYLKALQVNINSLNNK